MEITRDLHNLYCIETRYCIYCVNTLLYQYLTVSIPYCINK
ncbi:hypothetical protein YPPY13_3873 [Yersinia pestis PY-13]|uniref:Uncharacterized protein n=1 Tax=Yersinia pestis PY-08 TaxID=992134 RepID=A0AB72ZED1_YERPE|nr:hypothetical protein YPPY02_3846 [Yersinia pestis PY-02]EIR03184.1 hypothetical protein YPPY06_3895 [Yersinia pestis PY-06]EIR13896.1 hypothetical protein YPPY07_3762 [Yersinia pestis PY-07]EIR14571.1 hypothetical protein YPPY08_3892 [Yersinia pestis PY-08]EIR29289.1 hypothetical protein YPPY11_3982 [Yersinia pestis PY-11]EIR30380.1 hypothetical protein YPPY12_4018 [Yersinia pestis PY-12]EIR42601.1 hypothetical protein YPPY13_3873 [Yersinia pestis PY-13]EIR44079.1 hypothetical protein YPP